MMIMISVTMISINDDSMMTILRTMRMIILRINHDDNNGKNDKSHKTDNTVI